VTDDAVCRNCRASLHGRYCAACGQKATPLNPTVREFAHDFVHELLHVDGKIFQSVRHLVLSPGLLTRDHFEGRRARWISPIRLYLTFSVLFFAVSAVAPVGQPVQIKFKPDDAAEIRQLGFESEQEIERAIARAQNTWVPRLMFVLVPLFAALVHLRYRRRGHNYPQHLYFAFHVHAAWFAIAAVGAAAQWVPGRVVSAGVGIAVLIYAVSYLVIAFRRVYGETRWRAWWNAALVLFLYWLAVIATTVAIVVPIFYARR